ncbi:MAG: DedA family protein [Candidatus Promineifilaceae bacterium]
MEIIQTIIEFILHIDQHLTEIISNYGGWTYLILFLIVFCETGLVVTPFLPGDSLLFAAGALAALGNLDVTWLILLLMGAAILGDTVNYQVGHFIGIRAFSGTVRFLKPEYLERTSRFYEKHGGKAVVLARFVPIIRTFAPFVAGVGAMKYGRFVVFNIVGGVLWVLLFTLTGYFFGNLPIVRDNFSLVIMAIILISLVPIIYEAVKTRMSAEHA